MYISTYIDNLFLDIRIPTLHEVYNVVRHLFILTFVVAVRIEITIKFKCPFVVVLPKFFLSNLIVRNIKRKHSEHTQSIVTVKINET